MARFGRFGRGGWRVLACAALGAGCNDSGTSPSPIPPSVTIAAIAPVSGPAAGGTAVTITGSGFESGAGVAFAGTAATAIVVVSGTTITCATPAGAAGPAAFTVTNPSGGSATEPNGFTYLSGPAPAPALTGIAPASGPVQGGVSVTLTGSGFQTGATVTIGGAACTAVTVATAGRVICTTPAGGAPGQATVVLTNPDTQNASLVNGYLYLASGALDPGFGAGGVLTVDPSAWGDLAVAVGRDATALYVFGQDEVGGGPGSWRLEKRSLATGALVPGFGTGGVVRTNPGGASPWARPFLVDAGALYLAGEAPVPGTADVRWWLEKRDATTGALAPAGGGKSWIVGSNPSPNPERIYALATDGAALYVVGSDAGSGGWRIEKRSLQTAALVAGFGTGGVVTSAPSTGSGTPFGVTIAGPSLYVVGGDFGGTGGTGRIRIECRALATGALVPAFGSGGVVVSDPSLGPDTARAVASDATALYVAGEDEVPGGGDARWRVEKRSLGNGALIGAFGASGVVTSNPSSGWDWIAGILLDSTDLFVFGLDYTGSTGGQWRIEKRSLTTGALVSGFGIGGVVSSDPSTAYDVGVGGVHDGTFLYVAGWDGAPSPASSNDSRWRIEKRAR